MAVLAFGDMAFDLVYRPDFPQFVNALQKAGGLDKWWIEFECKVKKESRDIEAVNILAMAAAYSPNLTAQPLPIDFPFDLDTCELKPEVWARWLECDPVQLADRYADNLKRLRHATNSICISARAFSSKNYRRWASHTNTKSSTTGT